MNTLDLDPEWGAIDLIEEVEKEFGIKFTNEEVEPCETVGDFYAVLCARTPEWSADGERCASSMAFYRIRHSLDPDRMLGITSRTPLPSDIAPDKLVRSIVQETSFRLPNIRPTWLGMVGGAIFSAGCIAAVFALFTSMWLLCAIACVLAACGVPLMWMDQGRWPLGIATVGDLARRTAPLNSSLLRASGARPSSSWDVLVGLAAEHGSLTPDEITPGTFFHMKSLKLASANKAQ